MTDTTPPSSYDPIERIVFVDPDDDAPDQDPDPAPPREDDVSEFEIGGQG